MKLFRNILKISIILMIILIAVGSTYAADDLPSEVGDDSDDDFELDDSGDDLDDDDSNDDSGDDLDDDESDDDSGDDLDDDESDDGYSDFDFLEYKIMVYLEKYGNCTDEDWTESEDFLNEYQIYLANPSNYSLNESSEGYKTYLKIFDSITSSFDDYNLTDNETEYLKFMIIYYLNHYGNVSANYTWNESESFENFTLPIYDMSAVLSTAKGAPIAVPESDGHFNSYNLFLDSTIDSIDVNQTAGTNRTVADSQVGVESQDSPDLNIFILILVLVFIILIMI